MLELQLDQLLDYRLEVQNQQFLLVAAGVYILYTAILAFNLRSIQWKKVSTEKPVTMLNAMRILRKDIVFLVALVGIILSNCGFHI